MPPALAVVLVPAVVLAAAADDSVPSWVDSASRVGVVGFLVVTLYGLHRRWWVPGWVFRDLEERHARLRDRFDAAVDIALRSSRGVERSATVLEQALAQSEGP